MKNFCPVKLIFLFLLTGCATIQKQDLIPCNAPLVTPSMTGSPFSDRFEKALFKATLDIRKNHLTGYMLVKKTSDSSYRMVFSNEIGMTWFDLELIGEKITKHAVFGPMDKKGLIRILQQDFSALIYNVNTKPKPKVYCVSPSGNVALIGRTNPFVGYRIDFEKNVSGEASRMVIANPAIQLRMTLNLMSQ